MFAQVPAPEEVNSPEQEHDVEVQAAEIARVLSSRSDIVSIDVAPRVSRGIQVTKDTVRYQTRDGKRFIMRVRIA